MAPSIRFHAVPAPTSRWAAAPVLRLLAFLLGFIAASGASALEPIRLQLKWHHQFQFAGYYAALEKGFYRAAGLAVELVEATPEIDPVDEVVSGRAHFGVGTSALVLSRHQGKPVVVLASIFQHSPLVLLARADAGIDTVHDLAGKRLMLERNADELIAYLRKEGIEAATIDIQPHSFDAAALVEARVDAISAYSSDEPFLLDRLGMRHLVFTPRAAGIDFYGDNLFTSAQELREHPARVEAFRRASLEGWRYAMAHPQEIISLIEQRQGNLHGQEYLMYEAAHMVPLLRTDLIELGYMNPGRWQHIVDTYAELGLLPRDFPLDDFIYRGVAQGAGRVDPRFVLQILAAVLVVSAMAGFGLLRRRRRIARETTVRKRLLTQLRESENRFRFITENSADVIWTMDIRSGRFTYVSPSVERLRGYTPQEIMARPALDAVTAESAERIQASLTQSLARWNAGDHSDTRKVLEVDQPHRDGRIVRTEVVTTLHANPAGELVSVLGVSRDITERKADEDVIRKLAFYDALTGLPNRRLLLDRLEQGILRAEREDGRIALMFIDLDHFKPINDALGHDTGDWLLQQAAERMQACTRLSDTVARLGGDEFVVLLAGVKGAEDPHALGVKICQSLGQPFVTAAGTRLAISCSIGIALYPDHGIKARELLKCGDEAMYQAKAAGRNQVKLAQLAHAAASPPEDAALVRFHWRPSFASGHAGIDAEHRALFDHANALIRAAIERAGEPAALAAATQSLLEAITAHFASEEAVLEAIGYANRVEHAIHHQRLLERAARLGANHADGASDVSEWIAFIANEVVAGHMLREDSKFYALLPHASPDQGSGGDFAHLLRASANA